MYRFLMLFLGLSLVSFPAHAANKTASYYHNAFAAAAKGKTDLVESLVSRGPDPVLNKVLRGYAMAMPDNHYDFQQLDAFIRDNPAWADIKGIQMIAERKLPVSSMPPERIVAWFEERSPLTLVGFYRYIDALNILGYGQKAQSLVRKRWIEDDFTADEQTAFYARFDAWLTYEDMWARTDRLLWDNEQTQARRMTPLLNATDKAVMEARLTLAAQSSNARAALDLVPDDAKNEPGILFQRLLWNVKADQDDEAYEILQNAPSDLGNPEIWWEQRQIMVRRAIEKHDFALAYRLAERHGQTAPKQVSQAEFLCGWLALRFLSKPEDALTHFRKLYGIASTPITSARGAYWIGRAYEAMGKTEEATQAYTTALTFNTTYYGQLAATRIYDKPLLIIKSDPRPPQAERKAFFARDNARAIIKLAEIKEIGRARAFFRAAAENATKRSEFVMLAEIAQRIRRPDFGIHAVKAAGMKNILIQNGGFPVITLPVPNPPEPALTHALIRQESMFNPEAASSAGARGMMQLMPRTAKDMCKKLGVKYRERSLDNPAYNMKLGTYYANMQISRFDGSYILALAGYNAGPGRVREWIELFGDPRSGSIDPVDWVELIPIYETRNYVQRILESLQVYRSKLTGGQAPLAIAEDMKK